MIPLRRAFIVAQHGQLKYPEGTACAEVLKAGASDESRAAAMEMRAKQAAVDQGSVGRQDDHRRLRQSAFFITASRRFQNLEGVSDQSFGRPFEAGSVSIENNPALLGVGYIIGPRIASIMVGGGVLSYLVLIPAIKYFGSGWATPLGARDRSPDQGHERLADPESLRPLHRRRRGRSRRHHQLDPFTAGDLERPEGRPRGPASPRRRQRPERPAPTRTFR